MRRIDRTAIPPPSILLGKRAVAAKRVVEDVLAMDASTRSRRRAPIDEEIFLDPEVRSALRALCHDKCAYCETHKPKDAQVDHYRPVSNAKNGPVAKPHHYSWFAYEWANLYLSCAHCRRKDNYFPTDGKSAALLSSLDEARQQERPRLLDPGFDRPEKHLSFTFGGVCAPLSSRGKATIELLKLNRSELVADRRRVLQDLFKQLTAGSASRLISFLAPEAPFSGVCAIVLHRFAKLIAKEVGATSPSFDRTTMVLSKFFSRTSPQLRKKFAAELKKPGVNTDHSGTIAVQDNYRRMIKLHRPRIQMPGIRSVRICNFKAIELLEFEFPPHRSDTRADAACLMLLGENSTGKSSVLEAIALALIGPTQANQLDIKASEFIRRRDRKRWMLVDPQPASVRIDFHDDASPVELHISPAGERFEGTSTGEFPIIGYGARRYFSERHSRRSRAPRERVRSLFDVMATIPHPGPWLEALDEERFSAVARALREVLSLRDGDDLLRDEELGICVSANGQLTPLERLSDGYRSLFAMVVDTIRGILAAADDLETGRGLALIDEIETHLHPRWKMQVISSLRKAMPRVQFIATTHDPLCLRGMDDGEIAVLNRDENQNIEQLSDLPSVKGLRAEQLLTSDYFGLSSTADPQTEIDLARLGDALADPKRTDEARRLEAQLSRTVVLGDTAAEQVASDAIQKYLETRDGQSAGERTEARREAVSAFLKALEADESGRES